MNVRLSAACSEAGRAAIPPTKTQCRVSLSHNFLFCDKDTRQEKPRWHGTGNGCRRFYDNRDTNVAAGWEVACPLTAWMFQKLIWFLPAMDH
jgi:hypothetical protein